MRILYNCGRADDEKAVERLRRPARSILKRCSPEELVRTDPGIQVLDAWPCGDLCVLEQLGERSGVAEVVWELGETRNVAFPLERALFALVAHRTLAPASKLDCHERRRLHCKVGGRVHALGIPGLGGLGLPVAALTGVVVWLSCTTKRLRQGQGPLTHGARQMTKAEIAAATTNQRSSQTRMPALAALALLSPLAMSLYMPALPEIGDWFGVDIQRIELSVGFFLIGLGAGQIVGAPISDRFGRRSSTMLGLALFVASTIGILLSSTADQFAALRLVQGATLGMATVNIAALIADQADTQGTARSLSLIQMALAAGYTFTPIVGALLVGVSVWQSAFVILLVYSVLLGALLWIRLPETVVRSAQRRRPVFRQALRGYREVLGKPRAMAYAIGVSFAAGSSFVYFTDAAFLYMEWFGIGPRLFGLLLAFSTVAFMCGTVWNVRLLVRRRADRLVPIACVGQCLTAFLLLAHVALMTPSLPVVIALVVVVSGSLGLIVGNAGACFLAHFPDHRATASGIMGSLPNVVGGAVGAGLSGIHDGTPVTTGIGIAGCALVGVLAIAFARPVELAIEDAEEGM